MSSNTVQEVLGHADAVLIRERLDANPQFTSQLPPPVRMVFDWVLVIVRLLYRLIVLVLNVSNDRIDTLTVRLDDLQANPVFDFEHQPAPQPASQQAPILRAQPRPSKSTRCQRCHAMGHAVADCRTQDPATNKKRVSATQKAAKEMERRRIAAILPRAPPANSRFVFDLADFFGDSNPVPSSSSQQATRSMTTRSMTALAVDATELRRRKIQSTRDKRRRKAAASTNATT
jgi:hypothetical protein